VASWKASRADFCSCTSCSGFVIIRSAPACACVACVSGDGKKRGNQCCGATIDMLWGVGALSRFFVAPQRTMPDRGGRWARVVKGEGRVRREEATGYRERGSTKRSKCLNSLPFL